MSSSSTALLSPMCPVPAGMLRRGSAESPDEQPVGDVVLAAFEIDEVPVSNAMFAQFVAAGGYNTPTLWTPAGWEFVNQHQLQHPNYWHDPVWSSDADVPVTGVSWWEALAFARWAGRTLPTEAQWEWACRGPNGNTYPWGEEPPDLSFANFAPGCDPVERRPTRPDQHPRNLSAFGARDLVGNFAEWCLDNYRVGYESNSTNDPVYITDETDDHVVRGGCGLHDEDYLRCSARDHYAPGLRDNLIGFRCVRPSK